MIISHELGPIQVLSDKLGAFGLRLDQQTAGVREEIILRSDRVHQDVRSSWSDYTAYQRVNETNVFLSTSERAMVRSLFQSHLQDKGIKSADFYDPEIPKKDRHKGIRDFYGLQKRALWEFNALYKKLLDEFADQNALRVARRYCLTYRDAMYRACCQSPRFLQLAETFPLLAVFLFVEDVHPLKGDDAEPAFPNAVIEAREMVLKGKKLKVISSSLGIPYALRRLRPGAVPARCCLQFLLDMPDKVTVQTMPQTTPGMRRWIRVVETLGSDLEILPEPVISWFAGRLAGVENRLAEVQRVSVEIRDYARHTLVRSNEYDGGRRFDPSMSLNTAIVEADLWHRWTSERALRSRYGAAATGMEGFPAPWIEGTSFDADEIVPLTSQRMLDEEGARMRHCVSTYGERVKIGASCIYSYRSEGQSLATIELTSDRNGFVSLAQVQGRENKSAPSIVRRRVESWFKSNGSGGLWVPPPIQLSSSDGIPF